ncbi:hypothetical protein COCSUDRAFT_63314 [Coccomyxa subellipsoidea C-169]|uniref:Uncharacterized protein n=1 Tax=Coccomyxa subellipsoidea (strain C-169) TaxID=574566 RepID=I0YZH3_COCSC|nr:hypothetical protein COCSUDRAFT_63314 [Coccomyxa subellipsoidea C-169]EIE23792.1 hypothetical protein COCSUDRAFT_63314 [Coccomyxa subellipsoidea C-169]|eukprot:XP_005648336.1 hypothetical protein COCSUDRAFT_63314 [Coccomyxa subellipsoidea C-169]
MSFFARVFNHLVNEVLVQGLANNRVFQKFAVRSNAWMTELAKKSADKQTQIAEQAQNFHKTFREEMKKGVDEQFKRK